MDKLNIYKLVFERCNNYVIHFVVFGNSLSIDQINARRETRGIERLEEPSTRRV